MPLRRLSLAALIGLTVLVLSSAARVPVLPTLAPLDAPAAGPTYTQVPPSQTPFVVTAIPTQAPLVVFVTSVPVGNGSQLVTQSGTVQTEDSGVNLPSVLVTALASLFTLGIPIIVVSAKNRNDAAQVEITRGQIANETLAAAKEGAAKAGQNERDLAVLQVKYGFLEKQSDAQAVEIEALKHQLAGKDADNLVAVNAAIASAVAPLHDEIRALKAELKDVREQLKSALETIKKQANAATGAPTPDVPPEPPSTERTPPDV